MPGKLRKLYKELIYKYYVRTRDKKRIMKQIAVERIDKLLEMAFQAYRSGDPGFAKRYVELAHRIKLKHRVKLKKDTRLKYCKRCYTPWIPGRTVQVRVAGKKSCVEYRCQCGYIKRLCY